MVPKFKLLSADANANVRGEDVREAFELNRENILEPKLMMKLKNPCGRLMIVDEWKNGHQTSKISPRLNNV